MIVGLAATGCTGPELHDDIDIELDFELTPSDELHLPYVTGSTVRISSTDGDSDDNSDDLWTLQSSDESILRINSQELGSASVTAVKAGFVTMTVFDENNQEIHEAELEVVDPDRIELIPHGPLIIGLEPNHSTRGVNVLVGGTATMLVRYYRDDRLLHGNGALTATNDGEISAVPETTFIFENREWLQVTPATPGSHTITLAAGGVPLGDFQVTARTPDEVTSIELMQDEQVIDEEVEEGALQTVLGMARLHDGSPVYGAEFTWDLDGDGEPGTGDLFRYEYVEDVEKTLGANFDGLRAETNVHAREGYVDSSNSLGCSTSGQKRGSSSYVWMLGVMIALGASRRRRA